MGLRDVSNLPDDMCPAWIVKSRERRRAIDVERKRFLEEQNTPEVRAEYAAIHERLKAQGIWGASDTEEAREMQKK